MKKFGIFGIAALLLVFSLFFTVCGGGGGGPLGPPEEELPPPPPPPPTLTGLSISPAEVNVHIGGSGVTLEVSPIPASATLPSVITWSVTPASRLTLSSTTGTSISVSAPETASEGNATVTVSAEGVSPATRVVSVGIIPAPTSITITNTSPLNMVMGDSPQEILYGFQPSNADSAFIWETSNPTRVTVSQTGWVTAVSPGTSTITLKSARSDSSATPATIVVNVSPATDEPQVPVTHLHVSPNAEADTWRTLGAEWDGTSQNGNYLSPFIMTTVAQGQTVNLRFNVSPDSADDKRLVFRALTEAIAVIDTPNTNTPVTATSINIRGILAPNITTSRSALFSVHSYSDPDLIMFFSVPVAAPVDVSSIVITPNKKVINHNETDGEHGFPLHSTIAFSDGDGTAANPAILRVGGTGTQNTGTFRVAINGSSALPTNLELLPPIIDPSTGGYITIGTTTRRETPTGNSSYVFYDVTANLSTGALTDQVVKVTIVSDGNVTRYGEFYIRVLGSIPVAPTAHGMSFSPGNLGATDSPLVATQELTITPSFGIPSADIKSVTWSTNNSSFLNIDPTAAISNNDGEAGKDFTVKVTGPTAGNDSDVFLQFEAEDFWGTKRQHTVTGIRVR